MPIIHAPETMEEYPFVPSFGGIDWESSGEEHRRDRVRTIVRHASDYPRRSEYAWDADAWHDVFGQMRDDSYLYMDKRSCYANSPNTPASIAPNDDTSRHIKRVPDLSIGLASCRIVGNNQPDWQEFQSHLLQRALLHPNYGLIADAKWGETDLLFPFVVYEAKKLRSDDAWNNPVKEAYFQATNAAKIYLKMQATLVRQPGAAGGHRERQSDSSTSGQVFMFTSEGSKWTLTLAYWAREPERHFYTWKARDGGKVEFKSIWQGDLTREIDAWQLLYLIDSIHKWAISTYRSFIQRHLKEWHEAVERNFLLEWDGQTTGEPKQTRKRYEKEQLQLDQGRREDVDPDWGEPLAIVPYCLMPNYVRLPIWANGLNSRSREKLGDTAWLLLLEAWEATGELHVFRHTTEWTEIFLGRKHLGYLK